MSNKSLTGANITNLYYGESWRKTKGMFFGDLVIEAGILNDIAFWDVSDDLTDTVREYYETELGEVVALSTKNMKINDMSLSGRTVVEEDGSLSCGYVSTITINSSAVDATVKQVVEVNRDFNKLPNGAYDFMDVDKGTYTHRVCKAVLDGTLVWQSIANYDGHVEYSLRDYLGTKPEFLTVNGLFDTASIKTITAENSLASHGIQMAPSSIGGKNCIFINNGRLHLRLADSIVGAPYVTNLAEYLTNNPITLLLEYVSPKMEAIEVPELMAYDSETRIVLGKNESDIYPSMRVGLPVNLMETYNDLMVEYNSLISQQESLIEQQVALDLQRAETEEAISELMIMIGGDSGE